MAENHPRSQHGQTLVQVALLMVVLLAFAALAIDFGRIYLQRRFDQNGADAGALAGARAMCFGGMTYDEAKVVAETFAKQNVPNPGQTQVSFPAAGAGIMKVTVQQSALSTWLARVIGMDSVDVGATAAAACGPADTVCGLFPIAFPKIQWDQIKSCGEGKVVGEVFYTWSGDEDDRKAGSKAPDCSLCQCDLDGDGVNEVISEEGRGWIDFTGVIAKEDLYSSPCGTSNGCGTSEIKCWIENLEPAPIHIPPEGVCIGGDSGTKAGAKQQIDARAALDYPDDIVHIPIFDGHCPAPYCLEGFHVLELGCIHLLGWKQNMDLTYIATGKKGCWKGKLIMAEVSCDPNACKTACGDTEGGGCPPGLSTICAVNLVE